MDSGHGRLGRDLTVAYERFLRGRARRGRHLRIAWIAVFVALAAAGASWGMMRALGGPAPDHVRQDLAGVDQGLPPDLRLNPDVVHARAVASTGYVTLYAADLGRGGYCTEIVTAGERGRGAICTTADEAAA